MARDDAARRGMTTDAVRSMVRPITHVERWIALDTGRDGATADAATWTGHWRSLGAGGVVLSAGTLAPTGLSERALAGYRAFDTAARAAGMAVVLQVAVGTLDAALAAAHPDWVVRDGAGAPVARTGGVAACVQSEYFSREVPAALARIAAQLRPDGLLVEGWSGSGAETLCTCAACAAEFKSAAGRDLPKAVSWDDEGYRTWVAWGRRRRVALWNADAHSVATAAPACSFIGLLPLEREARAAMLADDALIAGKPALLFVESAGPRRKGRFREGVDEIRYLASVLPDAGIVRLTPAYQSGARLFSAVGAPAIDVALALSATIAAGAVPAVSFGLADRSDRRVIASATAAWPRHRAKASVARRQESVANIGLVWSRQNAELYGRSQAPLLAEAPYRGMVHALTDAGLAYRPIDIDASHDGLAAIVLPNIAAMSDAQAARIEAFVRGGGTVVATAETSLYDADGNARPDYALARVFGAHVVGPVADRFAAITRQQSLGPLDRPGARLGTLKGPATDHSYLRLTPERAGALFGPSKPGIRNEPGARHPLLAGFERTDIIAFGGILQPVTVDADRQTLLTYVPPFPNFPIDEVYMRVERTAIPGLVVGRYGKGRVVFLPADIDRRYGIDPLPDHAALLGNILRWAAGPAAPVIVSGNGVVAATLFRDGASQVLHLVNLTGCDNRAGAVDRVTPIGPIRVSVALPTGATGAALIGAARLPGTVNGTGPARRVTIEIGRLDLHETVVLT